MVGTQSFFDVVDQHIKIIHYILGIAMHRVGINLQNQCVVHTLPAVVSAPNSQACFRFSRNENNNGRAGQLTRLRIDLIVNALGKGSKDLVQVCDLRVGNKRSERVSDPYAARQYLILRYLSTMLNAMEISPP